MANKGTTTVTQNKDIQADIDSFVRTIIDEYQSRHRVTILSHQLESHSTAEVGQHFSSNVFRLNLTFEMNDEECRSSVVLKVPQLCESYALLKSLGLYEKEEYMYQTVLPRIHRFWTGKSMSPTYYGASSSGMLALENLQECGFCLPPKNTPMGLTAFKTVVKTLAQFHAASVKYFKLYGTAEFDSKTSFAIGDDSLQAWFVEKIKTHVIPTLSENLLRKWKYFETNIAAAMEDAYSPMDAGARFSVLLHGDVKAPNFLMKQQGDECKFIDFQLCRRGSPILDLMFLLVSSVEWEVFERHREDVFGDYLDTLNATLTDLECKDESYSMDQLNADFEKKKLYPIFVLCTATPLLRSEVSSFENMNEEQENKLNCAIRSAEFVSLFKNWLELVQNP